MDSVGVGALPDASEYGDAGSATLQNIIRECPDIHLPNLRQLGLFNIDGLPENLSVENPQALYCKSAELSCGKDTTVGHWEIMGVQTTQSFETYPHGFPSDVIREFEEQIGIHVLGNTVSSGTELLVNYGDNHYSSGMPIVYTSADSVFQIAAHEEIIPLDTLYDFCLIAKEILVNMDMRIGRVIARPFKGKPGAYYRTDNRKDFLLHAPEKTVLTILKDNGIPVVAVGKIEDIFDRIGLTKSIHTHRNDEGIGVIVQECLALDNGLIFANLVDFDMLYGHRRDVKGYAKELEFFDASLPKIIDCMGSEDVLMITADHGNDPTFHGTDHTREYIPVLIYGEGIPPINKGVLSTFADIGATILHLFNLGNPFNTGKSIL